MLIMKFGIGKFGKYFSGRICRWALFFVLATGSVGVGFGKETTDDKLPGRWYSQLQVEGGRNCLPGTVLNAMV